MDPALKRLPSNTGPPENGDFAVAPTPHRHDADAAAPMEQDVPAVALLGDRRSPRPKPHVAGSLADSPRRPNVNKTWGNMSALYDEAKTAKDIARISAKAQAARAGNKQVCSLLTSICARGPATIGFIG